MMDFFYEWAWSRLSLQTTCCSSGPTPSETVTALFDFLTATETMEQRTRLKLGRHVGLITTSGSALFEAHIRCGTKTLLLVPEKCTCESLNSPPSSNVYHLTDDMLLRQRLMSTVRETHCRVCRQDISDLRALAGSALVDTAEPIW